MRRARGFSVIEMMASIALSALIFSALYQLTSKTMEMRETVRDDNRVLREMQFAFDRMVRTASGSRVFLLPMDGNPRDLFAVTLPASVDRDGDGFADADNDKDGRIDEDPPGDLTNDEAAGIEGIDDDDDGTTDENLLGLGNPNDDEDFNNNDDPVNGVDDDGDGRIDEDPGGDYNNDNAPGIAGIDDDGDGNIDEGDDGDDDEDGSSGEDWFDAVVYRLNGTDLIERVPQPWDVRGDAGVDGEDWVENVILGDVSQFMVQRISTTNYEILDILLEVTDAEGVAHVLQTQVRVGGGS